MDSSEFEQVRSATDTAREREKALWIEGAHPLQHLKPTPELQQQLNSYANVLQQTMANVAPPLQELANSIQKAMASHVEALRGMQDAIRLPLLELTQNLASMQPLEGLRSGLLGQAGSLAQAAYEFGQRIQKSKAVDARPVLDLGWHLTPCMGFSDLFEALAQSTDEEKDAYLFEQVKGYLEEIISDVLTTLSDNADRFGGEVEASHRKRHLAAAFDAHRAGQYSLSIPALFAQVEGLPLAVLGESLDGGNDYFFSTRPAEREKGLETLARAAGDFKVLEAPLLGVSAYGIPIRDYVVGGRRCPNRHAVLHGRDLVFDTEMSSLKVITLVGYMVWLISEIEQVPSDQQA